MAICEFNGSNYEYIGQNTKTDMLLVIQNLVDALFHNPTMKHTLTNEYKGKSEQIINDAIRIGIATVYKTLYGNDAQALERDIAKCKLAGAEATAISPEQRAMFIAQTLPLIDYMLGGNYSKVEEFLKKR